MKKIYFVTLGCPKNRVDSEMMLGILFDHGYEISHEPEDADYLIVNTCGFILDAQQESVQTILELGEYKAEDPTKKLVVVGCLAQRFATDIEHDLPEVDHFIGTGEFHNIIEIIEGKERIVVNPSLFLQQRDTPRINSLPYYVAYLKIAEGCSNSCSFCAIPQIRGKQRSRSMSDIIYEAKNLIAGGVKELNLIAQELTAYGRDRDDGANLVDLIKELVKIDDLPWLRLLYNYPMGFSDELIELMATEEKIMNYVDLPLQHIAEPILKRMFRGEREQVIRNLITKLKNRIPGVALRASFIVGFPGETEADFQQLYRFVEETGFDHLGVFQYSPEEGTVAADLPDQIDEDIKEDRYRRLMALQQDISAELMDQYIGETVEVLVDGVSDETDLLLVGRHQKQALDIDGVTYINAGVAAPGDIVSVLIDQAGDYDLVGGIVSKES